MSKAIQFGIILLLGCLMGACTSRSASGLPTETPEQVYFATATTTAVASLTATAQPDLTPTATKTLSPAATSTLTPTTLPLNGQGPWVVVEKLNRDTAQQTYYVTGLSGTDWNLLNGPELTNQIGRWKVIPSSKGGYIAFVSEQIAGEQIPKFYEDYEKGLNLYIVKLPENKLIRTIPLVGSKAIEKINQEVEAQVSPVKLSVLGNSDIVRWSPDGRYLAFASAVDGIYPDVYLYDTETDAIERLTQDKTGAIPWDWSPDGKWLLYHQITANDYDIMWNLPEFKAVYAYSFITKSHFLYKAQWQERIKWITAHNFLIYNPHECIDCGDHLREGNLETGTVRQLYPGEFNSPYDDPVNQSILLNFTPNAYLNFDVEPGIYRLDRNTLLLKMFLPGSFEIGYWSKELEKYVAYARSEDDVETLTPIVYDESGQEIFRLPEAKYSPPKLQALQPSPDGNWFYVLDDEKTSLYNHQGGLIKELARKNLFWLRDSSALLQVDSSKPGAVYLYAQNMNWEPQLVHSLGDEDSLSDAWLIYP